jgi:hypothetical protein
VLSVGEWAPPESRGIVSGWLGEHLAPANGRWFGSVRLATYRLPSDAFVAETATLPFSGGVRGRATYVKTVSPYAPGDFVLLGLQWDPPFRPPDNLSVFVHLIDANGFPWAQYDGPLASEVLSSLHALFVQPGTPPGLYDVVVGIYDPSTGKRLQTPSGDKVLVASLWIESRSDLQPSAFVPQERRNHTVGSLRLLGVDSSRAGRTSIGARSIRAKRHSSRSIGNPKKRRR